MRTVLFGLALAWASTAAATDIELSHQLRATDANGEPVHGELPVTVELWTSASSTDAANDRLWSASLTPTFDGGYASLRLDGSGGSAPQAEWFAGDVWVDVEVDGVSMGARVPMADVPRSGSTLSSVGQTFAMPGGAFELVQNPTTWAATSSTYNGNISYSGSLGSWVGRPATTAICQELMGSGARLCKTEDVERIIAAGGMNAFGESNAERLSYPTACGSNCIVSSGGDTDLYPSDTTSHMYADCNNFTTGTSSRRLLRFEAPVSGMVYGTVETSSCSSSYPLLCCR